MHSFLKLLYIILPFSNQAIVHSHDISDNILCRHCGSDVLNAENIYNKISYEAVDAFLETVFNKSGVLIQILPQDFLFQFPVITATNSACLGIGEWSEDELWFPNYRWRPCVCSECGAHIGWIFQEANTQNLNTTNEFYALVLPNIVGESCKFQWYLFRGGRGTVVIFVCPLLKLTFN